MNVSFYLYDHPVFLGLKKDNFAQDALFLVFPRKLIMQRASVGVPVIYRYRFTGKRQYFHYRFTGKWKSIYR
jgi:hypothetical protein